MSPLLIAILLAIPLAVLAWCWFAWRGTHYSFPQACLYFINTLFVRLLWRTRVSGRLPTVDGQGAIIVCNHRSGIDPLLIQVTTNRVVHWLVAKEYVYHWSMSWAFRILQSIPVNRAGIDTAATKQAIRLAQNGGLVGLFPEGRINQTEKLLLSGRPGAALIALKARVPVIPCYVIDPPYNGTALGSFLMTARARVIVGTPIDISEYYDQSGDREVQELLTKRFLSEIAKLAGQPDFQPELAGKRWKDDADAGAPEDPSHDPVSP